MKNFHYYTDIMKIDPRVIAIIESAQEEVQTLFREVDEIAEYHQARILQTFIKHQISQRHFIGTTGYGYGDDGRDTLDRVYRDIFGSEDALVRPQWVSGTHVLGDSLFALLRPGDTLLSVTGQPYDTLNDVIGAKMPTSGSLKEWGVNYKEIALLSEGELDLIRIKESLSDPNIKVVFIQRSRGYGWRKSLSVKYISYIIKFVKQIRPNILTIVDNCYGEFTEECEPSSVGADLMVGSLIKNPGGGLAPTGAYAVGTSYAIKLLSQRLTSPSIGREVGSFPYGYQMFYQGLFLAPHIVGQAIKGATLVGRVFDQLGYSVLPKWDDHRSDIIQSIKFTSSEELITFCQAIQSASPVDGHVVPYPWDMPGYDHQVIMAAGTFIQGASIELSADAPIKEPYIVYLQGGLTYAHVKLAIMKVLTRMHKEGYIILD